MKTVSINLYQFNELSDEAKQIALEKLADINVDCNWWESTYEDAENVELKISGFDIDRGSYVTCGFMEGATTTARRIIAEHGEICDTYKLAKEFLSDHDKLVEKYSDGKNLNVVAYENEQDFDDDVKDLEDEFLKQLGECYLVMLRKEYEYRTSEAAIIETIEAREYDFTEDGELF